MLNKLETVPKLARVLAGPNEPLPEGYKYTLDELQEIKWTRILTEQERGTFLHQAGHVFDFFMWQLLGDKPQLVLPESPVYNSICQKWLMREGHSYPRTCQACGLFGPCKYEHLIG
jgi:hypothetical protein